MLALSLGRLKPRSANLPPKLAELTDNVLYGDVGELRSCRNVTEAW